MALLSNYDFVLVDLETTGGQATRDRITEIGLVQISQGRIVKEWQSLINPEVTIPPSITRLTGINQTMVANAPVFGDIAETLQTLLAERLFVAHNARFDYSFLKNEFQRFGLAFRTRPVCSVKLSRKLYPQAKAHGLDAIERRFNLACSNRHRALADARLIWEFFQAAIAELSETVFTTALDTLLDGPALPAHLDPVNIDDLPESPGVYRFYAESGSPLYVGKSVNLRARVLSHFNGDHRHAKALRMSQQIHRLDWTETASDFSAQLLESQEIKRLVPLYNRRLRQSQSLYSLILDRSEQGYCRVHPSAEIDLTHCDFSQIYGLFKNKRSAEAKLQTLARDHGICLKFLGLEKLSHGACFNYQLGRCRGACCGQETAEQFNLRLLTALQSIKPYVWPWEEPIVVKERVSQGREVAHLIANWCYIGLAEDESSLQELLANPPARRFDYDLYKILIRHLLRPKHMQIIPLSQLQMPATA